ncbi:MAG TPA: hypothetical protein VLM90_04155 [Candidatus Deferrimicrobium sp.]|nr:hypothetical protein [Candidatus Deferrimicrobium sp.]
MLSAVYLLLGGILLLVTLGRVVVRGGGRGTDWALETAFIRLDFPPEHRAVAQQLATGLAEVVGMKIKQLTPNHNLAQIADWADDRIYAKDLITLFVVAFNVRCDSNTTFRALVEKVAEKKVTDGKKTSV